MTPLAFSGAEVMKIKVRSFQAGDATAGKTELPSVTVSSDGTTLQGGRLHVPAGQQPRFEYLIQLFMPDGTKHTATHWKESQDMDVPIGSRQIKELFPQIGS